MPFTSYLTLLWMTFFGFVLCVCVGIYASRLNRFGYGWFFLSLLITPMLGICFLLALGPKHIE